MIHGLSPGLGDRYETDIQAVREGTFILLVSGESSGNGGEMRKTIPANVFYFNERLAQRRLFPLHGIAFDQGNTFFIFRNQDIEFIFLDDKGHLFFGKSEARKTPALGIEDVVP
jgi:hypothetical protein